MVKVNESCISISTRICVNFTGSLRLLDRVKAANLCLQFESNTIKLNYTKNDSELNSVYLFVLKFELKKRVKKQKYNNLISKTNNLDIGNRRLLPVVCFKVRTRGFFFFYPK